MPALFPRRLNITELLTLILGGDRTAPAISESNIPTGTEDVPESGQSCAETVPAADLQRASTATDILTPKVELGPPDDDISPDGTDGVVNGGLRAPTAVVELMSAAADRPRPVRRRSLISAIGRQLLKVGRRLCCWCGK